MKNRFYKNIALAITLVCSIQSVDLQCGLFESLTGQITAALTGLKNTVQKNQTTVYIVGGFAVTAVAAWTAYYLKKTQKLTQKQVEPQIELQQKTGITRKKVVDFFEKNCAKKLQETLKNQKIALIKKAEELKILEENQRRTELIKKAEKTLECNGQLDGFIARLKKQSQELDQLRQELNQAKDETKKVYEELQRLPFVSDKDMRDEYMKLCMLEQNIQEKKSKAKTVAWEKYSDFTKAILPTDEIAKHHKKLITFYQRLFRTIVKKDIKKKLAYTIDLGLKISAEGTLTMALRPLSAKERYQQNILLFILSRDGDKQSQEEAKMLLQKLHDIRINQSLCADAFFPEIVLVNDDDEKAATFDKHLSECFAYYREDTNKIYIRERQLKIKYCREVIHEFGHLKQRGLADTMGGYLSRPLRSEYVQFPYRVALEIDTELGSIEDYPHKKHLQKLLKTNVPPNSTVYAKNKDDYNQPQIFPYLSPIDLYAVTLLSRNCKSNKKINKLMLKLYEERKKNELSTVKNCLKAIETNQDNLVHKQCIGLIKQSDACIEDFKDCVKKNIDINNKPIEQLDLDYACDRVNGCQEYFELKEKLGLIPK